MSQARREKRRLLTRSQVKEKVKVYKRFNGMMAYFGSLTIDELDSIKGIKKSKTDQQAFDVVYEDKRKMIAEINAKEKQ